MFRVFTTVYTSWLEYSHIKSVTTARNDAYLSKTQEFSKVVRQGSGKTRPHYSYHVNTFFVMTYLVR